MLDNLRKATKGTINDLTLMQAAVRADKFKIPMENLAGLFQFASKRARETGQSVNFLVDSIVDGIGRKSPLILDNLGIRAQDLQDEFKKTGDFAKAAANVISREMGSATDVIELQADSVDRLAAKWENFQLAFGQVIASALLDTKDFFLAFLKGGPALAGASYAMDRFNETLNQLRKYSPATVLDEAATAAKNFPTIFTSAGEAQRVFAKGLNDLGQEIKDIAAGKKTGNLGVLNEELSILSKRFTDTSDPLNFSLEQLRKYQSQIEDLDAAIKALTATYESFGQGVEVANKPLQAIKENTENLDKVTIKTAQVHQTATENMIADDERRKESARSLQESSISLLNSFAEIAGDNAAAQIGFAIAQVLAANAQALAIGVAEAVKIGFPQNIPAIFSTIATLTAVFAQIKQIGDQAKAAIPTSGTSNNFAEGEVDIHRPGEKRGKDSIPSMLMPGESVMTTEETARYKPILEAIRGGTLEDLIHQNYIEPSLAVNALEHAKNDSTELDYSERFYRQLLATGEGNSINKRAIKYLDSIDRKLSGSDYTKKYKR